MISKQEQRKQVAKSINDVVVKIQNKIDNIPEHWGKIEIEWWIASKFQDECVIPENLPMGKTKYEQFQKDLFTYNL